MKQLLDIVKANWILVIIVLLLMLFALWGVFQGTPGNQKSTSSQEKQMEQSTKSRSESEDEKNYRKAKLVLDRPYSSASQQEKEMIVPDVTTAIDFVTSHDNINEMNATLDNHLYMSEVPMIQTLWIAIHSNGYIYDSSQLEVLKSDNGDVLQLLLVFSKEGANKVYFTANYNTTVKQIQITRYFGGPIGATYG